MWVLLTSALPTRISAHCGLEMSGLLSSEITRTGKQIKTTPKRDTKTGVNCDYILCKIEFRKHCGTRMEKLPVCVLPSIPKFTYSVSFCASFLEESRKIALSRSNKKHSFLYCSFSDTSVFLAQGLCTCSSHCPELSLLSLPPCPAGLCSNVFSVRPPVTTLCKMTAPAAPRLPILCSLSL